MKLLQNPIAVTALAVLAGAYAVWTAFGARGFRSSLATAATTTATGTAVSVPSPLAPPQPTTTSAAVPIHSDTAVPNAMEPAVILSHARRWLEAPPRDPFRIEQPTATPTNGPSAAQVLTLRAVWRQSGSALAILNGQILREGDRLQGFDIESIEADAVWVRSPNGRERVPFSSPPTPQALVAQTAPAPTTEHISAALPIAPLP